MLGIGSNPEKVVDDSTDDGQVGGTDGQETVVAAIVVGTVLVSPGGLIVDRKVGNVGSGDIPVTGVTGDRVDVSIAPGSVPVPVGGFVKVTVGNRGVLGVEVSTGLGMVLGGNVAPLPVEVGP